MGSSVLSSVNSLEGLGLRHSVQSSQFTSASRLHHLVAVPRRRQSGLPLSRISGGDTRKNSSMKTVVAKMQSQKQELSQSLTSLGYEKEMEAGEERGLKENASSFALYSVAPMLVYPLIAEGPGYSQASYYTSLGLFVISVPGIWSLVKRSIKSKIVRKTFAMPSPKASGEGKLPSQIAGEITSSLGRNNFAVADAGETVTFEGTMVPNRGQAAFLSFCTAVSLGSVALVLTITVPDVGAYWYYLMVLSPLAGFYYWTRASRKEQIKVKMIMADDETSTDVIIQGDDEQIDRLRRELGLMEKGMVYVKGILEQ